MKAIPIMLTVCRKNTQKQAIYFLAKLTRNPVYKGFKIVEISGKEETGRVIFLEAGEFNRDKAILFSTEQGQSFTTHHESEVVKNPEGFAGIFIPILKDQLADHVAELIEYTITEEIIERDTEQMFPEDKTFPKKELIAGNGTSSIYDLVQCDSENEFKFVERLNDDDYVILFFKFLPTFKIRIPRIIGNYNPDWGMLRWDDQHRLKLELVRETKGNLDLAMLQYSNEGRKIKCAGKHFASLGVSYRHVTSETTDWGKEEESKTIRALTNMPTADQLSVLTGALFCLIIYFVSLSYYRGIIMRKVFLLVTALALLFIFSGCETMDTVLKGAEVVGDITDKAPVPAKGSTVGGIDFKKGEVLCSWHENENLLNNSYYVAKIMTAASAATKNQAEVLFIESGEKKWSHFVIPSHKADKNEMKLGKVVFYHHYARSEEMSAENYRKDYWRLGRISSVDELFKGKVEVAGDSMFVKWLRLPDKPVE